MRLDSLLRAHEFMRIVCGLGGFVKRNGKLIPPERVATTDMPYEQLAWISPNSASRGSDFWFQYEPSDPESLRKAALDVLPYLLQLDI